jgi:Domain of unknown function (DUF4276)
MKIGLIVDGRSEYESMPLLVQKLSAPPEIEFVRPVLADLQPGADVALNGRLIVEKSRDLARSRAINLAVVLMDREQDDRCPGEIASSLEDWISARSPITTRIVIKDRAFENWLIADVQAFEVIPGRFAFTNSSVRRVKASGADGIDAHRLIEQAVRGDYRKVSDSQIILRHARPEHMAATSRSFRRFLRVVEHPHYLEQSKRPYRGPTET